MKLRHSILIGELVGGIVFLTVFHLFFAVSLTISLIILFVILFPIEIIRQFELISKWIRPDKRGIYILHTIEGYRVSYVEYPEDLYNYEHVDQKKDDAMLVLNFGESKSYVARADAIDRANIFCEEFTSNKKIKVQSPIVHREATHFPKMAKDEALKILPYYKENTDDRDDKRRDS